MEVDHPVHSHQLGSEPRPRGLQTVQGQQGHAEKPRLLLLSQPQLAIHMDCEFRLRAKSFLMAGPQGTAPVALGDKESTEATRTSAEAEGPLLGGAANSQLISGIRSMKCVNTDSETSAPPSPRH